MENSWTLVLPTDKLEPLDEAAEKGLSVSENGQWWDGNKTEIPVVEKTNRQHEIWLENLNMQIQESTSRDLEFL